MKSSILKIIIDNYESQMDFFPLHDTKSQDLNQTRYEGAIFSKILL
jgi:hypothetical protein